MTRSQSSEIVFLVEEDPDGGLTARALGHSIFTQADTMEALKESVRDAVRCHFFAGGAGQAGAAAGAGAPALIRLHWVRDEVIAA